MFVIAGIIKLVHQLFVIVDSSCQVAPKRWRIDINYSQDAVLMLSSMNLPDGIQVPTFFYTV